MEDAKPSETLEALLRNGALDAFPFSMLSRLQHVPQSPTHHPEGNVWKHTMLVVDEAAFVKASAGDPLAFMWAALLHDIGKATTTQRRKGRITSYDHDKAGAALVRRFFACLTEDADFVGRVAALVRWHMQILFVVKGLPFADVAGMKRECDPRDVARLGLCDRLGRGRADRDAEEETIARFLEVISSA